MLLMFFFMNITENESVIYSNYIFFIKTNYLHSRIIIHDFEIITQEVTLKSILVVGHISTMQ